ncbi:Cys-every-fifth RiPP peptide CefA [Kordia jejudonensis]|uniref:Cys-every-fifth RiPP peptide CefA n=1 Tax=Kordia jejudonensis TaxID=1348245 RepID=UPI00187DB6E0
MKKKKKSLQKLALNKKAISNLSRNQVRGGILVDGPIIVTDSDYCPSDFCPSDFCPSNGCPSNGCPSDFCPSNFCPSRYCPIPIDIR